MGHKTLTISEEAYEALARLKRERESFTDAIIRLTKKVDKGSLLDYVRSLGPDDEFARIMVEILGEREKVTITAPEL
jgi:predicted CopG family antitoxin